MWHASIVVLRRGRPVPYTHLSLGQRRLARSVARSLLSGVGVEPSREDVRTNGFHLRRALSESEIAALDPAWVAIPAVDMGG